MELKKSKEANINSMRLPMVLVGLLFVGSLILASFSYQVPFESGDKVDTGKKKSDIQYAQEEIAPPPPPPDTPPPPQVDAPPPPAEEIKEEENTEKEPEPTVPVPPPVPTGPKEQPKIIAEVVEFPDVEAGFPGGAAEMQKWIRDNVVYPETAIEMNEQGRVYLSFVVEPDGSISNIKVERGVSSDLDKEAKRVVRRMPKWTPGEAGGKKVRTRCRLPIIFQLD